MHYHIDKDGNLYVDTTFISCNNLKEYGLTLHHGGFGFFHAETPEGRVDFDRLDHFGDKYEWQGCEGRPHLVRGGGAHWLKNRLQVELAKAEADCA